MPLADFIRDVDSLLENNDAIREIQVKQVMFLREAEASGDYDTRYEELNKNFGART